MKNRYHFTLTVERIEAARDALDEIACSCDDAVNADEPEFPGMY